MNKKSFGFFAVFVLLIVISFGVLSSCSLFGKTDTPSSSKKYNVVFISDEERIATISTAGYETLTLPTLSKDGMVFEGWYLDQNSDLLTGTKLTADYFENSGLSSDLTVYARFSVFRDISVSKTELTLTSGESGAFLDVTVVPADSWNDVTYSSSDPAVVDIKISQAGDVTVTAKDSGEAVLSISYAGKTVECAVTVEKINVDVMLDGQKVATILTNSKGYYSVDIPVDLMEHLPERTAEGKYFSGWFIDEEMTKPFGGIEKVKKGDVVCGEWKDFSSTDFTYSVSGGELEITKFLKSTSYLILPSQWADQPVKRLSSTFFRNLSCAYLYVPETVKQIFTRSVSSLKTIEVSDQNENYKSIDGVLYNKQGTMLEYYPTGRKDQKFIVPAGVASIYDSAFSDCRNLKEIDFNDVTMIYSNAVKDCIDLEKVTFSEDVSYIGEYAFSGCKKLDHVTLPGNLVYLKKCAFEDCVSLTEITLPEGVTAVEEKLFSGCAGLTAINYLGQITSIGKNAFSGCSSLTLATIPASVTSIEENPFMMCESLEEIAIESGNTSFTDVGGGLLSADGKRFICFPSAFASSVYSVSEGVEKVDRFAFYGSQLIEISLPNSVTEIGDGVFARCVGLTSITVPFIGEKLDKLNPIGIFFGSEEFEGGKKIRQNNGSNATIERVIPTSLGSVTVTGNVVGYGAFQECDFIQSVSLPNVVALSWYTFSNCYSLTDVILGDGLTEIGGYSFNGCLSLKTIVIPQSVTRIESGTFYNANCVTIYCEAESAPANYKNGWNKTYFGGDYEEVPTYWYSENEPEGEGLLWHYVNDVPTKW